MTETQTKCRIFPTVDRVVVTPFDPGEQRKGSIIIADIAKDKRGRIGIVEMVGSISDPSKPSSLDGLRPGQKILYSQYSGLEWFVDQTEYVILTDKEVYGVLGEE
jgi:chaperonin GroES